MSPLLQTQVDPIATHYWAGGTTPGRTSTLQRHDGWTAAIAELSNDPNVGPLSDDANDSPVAILARTIPDSADQQRALSWDSKVYTAETARRGIGKDNPIETYSNTDLQASRTIMAEFVNVDSFKVLIHEAPKPNPITSPHSPPSPPLSP